MCTCLWRFDPDTDTKLILLFARDEQKDRPTAPLHRWPSSHGIVGGRDLQSGGTWLGVNRSGFFTAITYFRDLSIPRKQDPPSRGILATEMLSSNLSSQQRRGIIEASRQVMDPFNIVMGGPEGVDVFTWNGEHENSTTGVHGVSNGPLTGLWGKVRRGMRSLESWRGHGDELDILRNTDLTPDADLPQTGLPIELERRASAIFVEGAHYGTRSITSVRWRKDGQVTMREFDVINSRELTITD